MACFKYVGQTAQVRKLPGTCHDKMHTENTGTVFLETVDAVHLCFDLLFGESMHEFVGWTGHLSFLSSCEGLNMYLIVLESQ